MNIYAQRKSDLPIRTFVIFGERHSGTTYIKNLILANFPYLTCDDHLFGWKHGPAWLDAPLESFPGNPKGYFFEPNDLEFFIVVFRNPYDWLHSMWKFPYHASQKLFHQSFSKFIRMPWEIEIHDKNFLWRSYITAIDRNPIDGSLFKNVMNLRTAKIKNMLRIKEKVQNIYYINYETVRDRPEDVIRELSEIFNLPKLTQFVAVDQYCSQGKLYTKEFVRQDHFVPDREDLHFINSELDEFLEKSIGYNLE